MAPATWALVDGVLEHHEVEAANQGLVEAEVRIIGELKDIGHSVAIAHDREPGLPLSVGGLLTSHRSHSVTQGHVVPLDAVRSANGASEGDPPEEAHPSAVLWKLMAQAFPNTVYLPDHVQLVRTEFGAVEEHSG